MTESWEWIHRWYFIHWPVQLFEYFNFVMNSNNWFLSSLTCAPLNSYPGNSIFSPNNFSSFFSTNCLSNIVMWSPCLLKHTPNFRDVFTKFYFPCIWIRKLKQIHWEVAKPDLDIFYHRHVRSWQIGWRVYLKLILTNSAS